MFPARAGMSPTRTRGDEPETGVPRTSGDEPDPEWFKNPYAMCSPRERG